MKTAILLDLDDTLLDIERGKKERNEFITTKVPVTLKNKIEQYLKEYHAGQHQTFNYHSRLTAEESEIMHQQSDRSMPKLVFADVLPWITNLDTDKYQAMIITFGDKDFQQRKIQTSGLDILPVIYTSCDSKAELISEWLCDDYYLINDQPFEKIIFVDDKTRHFDGFNGLPQARGYLMRRREGVKKSGTTTNLPKNVSAISSLDEIPL
jgi:FMN phosphatase YigB (HAD superfamily)